MLHNLALMTGNFLTQGVNKIVMYHKLSNLCGNLENSVKLFENQLLYLQRNYKNRLLSSPSSDTPGIHLTFDDGYLDFYEIAYPLLVKYEVPATFYVCTGFINKELWMWYDKIEYLLESTQQQHLAIAIEDKQYSWQLGSRQLNHICTIELQSALKTVSTEKVESYIHALGLLLEVEVPDIPPHKYAACDWEHLRAMDNGLINIGGHSHTHPILTNCTEQQIQFELNHCTELLKSELNSPIEHFCYPNGQATDFSEGIIKQLKALGYSSAVTAFTDGHNEKDVFKLRRCSGVESMYSFKKHINGIEHLSKKWNSFKKG